MILFHHRAVEARPAKTGCRGWNRISIRAFKGRCPTIRRPGILETKMENGRWKMAEVRFDILNLLTSILAVKDWWPARVMRPVLRIKSPLHHFNACRPKLVLVAGFAPALATPSTSCLFWLGYTSKGVKVTSDM